MIIHPHGYFHPQQFYCCVSQFIVDGHKIITVQEQWRHQSLVATGEVCELLELLTEQCRTPVSREDHRSRP
jgi:hypothetical protein